MTSLTLLFIDKDKKVYSLIMIFSFQLHHMIDYGDAWKGDYPKSQSYQIGPPCCYCYPALYSSTTVKLELWKVIHVANQQTKNKLCCESVWCATDAMNYWLDMASSKGHNHIHILIVSGRKSEWVKLRHHLWKNMLKRLIVSKSR